MSIRATTLQIALVVVVMIMPINLARADGITLGIVTLDTPEGLVVTKVISGGIADRTMPRLRPGAYIVGLNGKPIDSGDQFRKVLQASQVVKFQFVDPKGELRWGKAWSGRRVVVCCP